MNNNLIAYDCALIELGLVTGNRKSHIAVVFNKNKKFLSFLRVQK